MEHSQHPNPRLLSCLSWAPISLPNYRGSSKGEIFKKGGVGSADGTQGRGTVCDQVTRTQRLTTLFMTHS